MPVLKRLRESVGKKFRKIGGKIRGKFGEPEPVKTRPEEKDTMSKFLEDRVKRLRGKPQMLGFELIKIDQKGWLPEGEVYKELALKHKLPEDNLKGIMRALREEAGNEKFDPKVVAWQNRLGRFLDVVDIAEKFLGDKEKYKLVERLADLHLQGDRAISDDEVPRILREHLGLGDASDEEVIREARDRFPGKDLRKVAWHLKVGEIKRGLGVEVGEV